MVTIILGSGGSPDQYIYTIKPGGAPPGDCDYTTLNNWESGTRSNLVTQNRINIAEVMGGGNSITGNIAPSAGWTTDATRYIVIRAAAGHQHSGVWDTNKAYMLQSANDAVVQSMGKDIHIEKMQIKTASYGLLFYMSNAGGQYVVDSNLIIQTGAYNSSPMQLGSGSVASATLTFKNNIVLNRGGVSTLQISNSSTSYVYNNTLINTSASNYCIGGNASTITNNNYMKSSYCYSGVGTMGVNDAASNSQGNPNGVVTANLRSIPYSTATFQNITVDSENLRPVVSGSNKLLDNGANLTGSGVTTDIIGTARPLFGGFDIGAFENDIPICWNYTARYKNSNKLFKASGCGNFPKSLQVPSNVDTSTGKMVDDGIFISPDKYKIV